jgi:hypothetical protein
MLIDTNPEKRQALIDLMAMPDAPGIRRGHHMTVAGREDRHRMVHHLAASFVQWRRVQTEERAADWESMAYAPARY